MIAWLGKILLAFNNITETAYDFKTGLEICCLNKYLRVHWNLINVLMWSERHLKNWLAKSSWQVWPVALSIFLLAMHVPENTHFRGEIITVWLVSDCFRFSSYTILQILLHLRIPFSQTGDQPYINTSPWLLHASICNSKSDAMAHCVSAADCVKPEWTFQSKLNLSACAM